jgi:hypothetical protein
MERGVREARGVWWGGAGALGNGDLDRDWVGTRQVEDKDCGLISVYLKGVLAK